MIDALFGSKTRVKLLHLFLNNPGKAFYVREITRLIDEQINSVRSELSNMISVGIVTSRSTDNKLYYEVNQRHEFYPPFRVIFADSKSKSVDGGKSGDSDEWQKLAKRLSGARVVVVAGILVDGSASKVDLLVVGDVSTKKISTLVNTIEKSEGRELTYSVLSYDEFYYRLSVRDKFVNDILTNRHTILIDTDNIIK